jgi:hypothetical protein
MEVVVLGGVDIHVKYGCGIDPYVDLSMPKYMNVWQKNVVLSEELCN